MSTLSPSTPENFLSKTAACEFCQDPGDNLSKEKKKTKTRLK